MTEEEKAEQLRIEQDQAAKAVKKKVVKDGASEKVLSQRFPELFVQKSHMVCFAGGRFSRSSAGCSGRGDGGL